MKYTTHAILILCLAASTLYGQGNLQIRRYTTSAGANAYTPLDGELIYDKQGGSVRVGDGSTAGGNPVGGGDMNRSTYDTDSDNVVDSSENLTFLVQNETGVQINAGAVVYINGFDVVSDLPTIALADADSAATMPALGIVNANIAHNNSGTVVVAGQWEGNTSAFNQLDELYVSTTAGALTATKPTGTALIQKLAVVARDHASSGLLEVSGSNRESDLPNIPSAQFWLGNASGVATAVSMSGDATLNNAGALTLAANSVGSSEITDGSIAAADLAFSTGDVFKVGTPANDQIAVWTGDGTLEGIAGVTYDGSALTFSSTTPLAWSGGDGVELHVNTGTESGIIFTNTVTGDRNLILANNGNTYLPDIKTGADAVLSINLDGLIQSSATLSHELGGLEANVGAYTGLLGITGGATVEVDTIAELNTAMGFTGTADATTYLRGDGSWQTVATAGAWTADQNAGGYALTNAAGITYSMYNTESGAAVGVAVTIDGANGSAQTVLLDEPVTATFASSVPPGFVETLLVEFTQDGTGGNGVTLAGGTFYDLAGATITTLPSIDTTASAATQYVFRTTDGGTTWLVGEGADTVSPAELADGSDTPATGELVAMASATEFKYVAFPVEIGVAASDETTDLTTGTAKVTFRAPYAFTLTGVRANVNTAPTGSTLNVDINEAGVSVLSTVLTIDATEETSTTAATPAVISDSAIADDAEITIDIDQIGSSTAGKGLKVWLIGTRAL